MKKTAIRMTILFAAIALVMPTQALFADEEGDWKDMKQESKRMKLDEMAEDAMKALFDEADSLGAVLSGSAIRGVEQFNDEFNKLQTLITGITNQFVAALAPALKEVTEDLVNFLKETAPLGRHWLLWRLP